MTDRLTAERARQVLDESSAFDPWRIGYALDRDGPPLRGGVLVDRLAAILMLHETKNWSSSLRSEEADQRPFAPYSTRTEDDGRTYRTFLPGDLRDEEEEPLRAFAMGSGNPVVRARVAEVLWDRFRHHEDADVAMDARFAATELYDAETDWPGLVKNLGRLTTLILSLNASARVGNLVEALHRGAERLTRCSRPFSFTPLCDMVCNTLLTNSDGREVFTTERAETWAGCLRQVADRYAMDAHHGHDALFMLQAWQMRLGQSDAAAVTRRRVIEHLMEVAAVAEPVHAPSHLQRALQHALDFGFSDLSETTRLRLAEAVRAATTHFGQIANTFSVPKELIAAIDELLHTSPTLAVAVRRLAVMPGLLEVDVQRLRDEATEQMKEFPLLATLPAERFNADGKVTHRSNDVGGTREEWVARFVGLHLVLAEALLGHFLRQAVDRFERETLVDALARWPLLPPHRHALLAASSERFAARDWISAGVIVATAYEAILRDLLRALGYPAMKVEPGGILMDERLNSLLRGTAARTVLGVAHCDLVEHVLCDAALGPNLRNEIAHGTVRPDALSPTRVLLMWLFVVRVTCIVPTGTAGEEPAVNQDTRSGVDEQDAGKAAGVTAHEEGDSAAREPST